MLGDTTYNNPGHGDPYRPASSEVITVEEVQNATS